MQALFLAGLEPLQPRRLVVTAEPGLALQGVISCSSAARVSAEPGLAS